jgi:RHS repeat-associated protein
MVTPRRFIFLAGILALFIATTVTALPSNPPNRTVPEHSTPQPGLALPANPSAADIQEVRIFSEPLVPLGREPTARENIEAAAAIRTYADRSARDDFSALEDYVREHPQSPWTPVVWFDLAADCYQTGWYSKALAGWEQSWLLLASATDPAVKPIADRSAGELAYMYGRLGRMTELAALLDSVTDRVFTGPAAEKIAGARQGMWTMQNWPGVAFRCGPYALDRIRMTQDPSLGPSSLVHDSKSTTNGFALTEVADLSRQLGMNYQMAQRKHGAPFIVPAVVNWKVGHYAALVKETNGLYLLQDPTFGNDTWISAQALEEETSGYFLVPPGVLPQGWRTVSEQEGRRVFGKGSTTESDPSANTAYDPTTENCGGLAGAAQAAFRGAAQFVSGLIDKYGPSHGVSSLGISPYAGIRGMATSRVRLLLVSLNVQDIPVGYEPPVGPPVWFLVNYNDAESDQPATFSYSNLGQQWTFNWLAYITDDPQNIYANVNYFTDEGGTLQFTGFNNTSQMFAPETKSQAILTRTSTNSYEMLMPDGSKREFTLPGSIGGTSRQIFMTQVVDPMGNAVNITYDANFRVVAVTDAIGQVTTLTYGNTNDILKITQVTDPFGRSAAFTYDSSNRLAQITDSIGLTSQFTYNAGDIIQSMITPYGTTSYQRGGVGRQSWLVTTYPDGAQDRVEYNETSLTYQDPGALVPQGMYCQNSYLIYRNTFYWDRQAYKEGAGDYTKAQLYHWLHLNGNETSGVLESTKAPLENRVWYDYDGQSPNDLSAIQIGATAQPNTMGRVLDDGTSQLTRFKYNALGRITNSVDPLGRSMSYVYSSNLVDLLEMRQTTGTNNELIGKFLYNTQHLVTAALDAAGQLTTNTYNARGQILTTTNPRGETRTYSYDTNGYLLSVDGPLPGSADSLAFTYDAVGRLQTARDTDGYTVTNYYDNLDRLTNVIHPDGTFSSFTYDKLDCVADQDRLGRVTRFTYDALRRQTSVQDPLNRIVQYEYCNCGLLSALIDPLGRRTTFTYDLQGRLTTKTYADGSTLSYTYEDTTSRLKSICDERGQFKYFTYYPDNNPSQISYPNAQFATPTVNYTYDSNYNRITSIQDGLGTTTNQYVPAGMPGALQLAEADGPFPNEVITYQYDVLSRMTNLAINGVPQTMAFDSLNRVTNVVNALGGFNYNYDGTTMRLLGESYPNGQTNHYAYFGNLGDHCLQQITSSGPGAALISRFTYAPNVMGMVTNWIQEIGTVSNNWSLVYDAADQLTSARISQAGTNLDFAYGYDDAANRILANNTGTNLTYQPNLLNQIAGSSDMNGAGTTYEWDAEQRLTAINSGINRTEFSYDAQDRRCRIVELTNRVVGSDLRYVWCGSLLCEEHNASNVVVRRFFDQGVQVLGTGPQPATSDYYYTRDHLGSVRELVDASGQVQSRYSYDPFGQRSALLENVAAPFGFTGIFRHPVSGLYMALNRPLDVGRGRWLARDPLGEKAGLNLYAYVGNNPINDTDPLGACGDLLTPQERKQQGQERFELIESLHGKVEGALEALDKAKELAEKYSGRFSSLSKVEDELAQIQQSSQGFARGVSQFGSFLTAFSLVQNGINYYQDPTLGNYLSFMKSSLAYVPVIGQAFLTGYNGAQTGMDLLYSGANTIFGEERVANFLTGSSSFPPAR